MSIKDKPLEWRKQTVAKEQETMANLPLQDCRPMREVKRKILRKLCLRFSRQIEYQAA